MFRCVSVSVLVVKEWENKGIQDDIRRAEGVKCTAWPSVRGVESVGLATLSTIKSILVLDLEATFRVTRRSRGILRPQ